MTQYMLSFSSQTPTCLRKPDQLKLFLSWTFILLHIGKTPTFVQAVQTTVTASGVHPTASFFFPKQHHKWWEVSRHFSQCSKMLPNLQDLSENWPTRQNNQHRMITNLMAASSDWSLYVYTHYNCMSVTSLRNTQWLNKLAGGGAARTELLLLGWFLQCVF